jgi:hypothetical protein
MGFQFVALVLGFDLNVDCVALRKLRRMAGWKPTLREEGPLLSRTVICQLRLAIGCQSVNLCSARRGSTESKGTV